MTMAGKLLVLARCAPKPICSRKSLSSSCWTITSALNSPAQLDVVGFAQGESIFNYGEPGDAIYVISSGEVELFFKNDTGERIVLEVATRGDFFGELSMLDSGTRSASVVATQDTQALRLDREDLEKFLQLRPQAAMDLLAAMGRRHRETVELLRHTATRNVNEEPKTNAPLWKRPRLDRGICRQHSFFAHPRRHLRFLADGELGSRSGHSPVRSLSIRFSYSRGIARGHFPLCLRAAQPEPPGRQGSRACRHRV